MQTTTRFPLTNQELFELSKGEPLRFTATIEEYWELLEAAEYRVDFFNREIIASMSYESEQHSALTSRFSHLLQRIFWENPKFKVHNSNRPICIPTCDFAVFNPDGSVVAQPAQLFEYRPGMNAEQSPVLLFEVLSKNTRSYDFGDKLPCYKQIDGLQHILFLESDHPEVLVIERQPSPGQWLETRLTALEDAFMVNGQAISLRELYGDPA
ncbi:MAG: Uma2 family endonuclease [Saprospiraceae bacterium]|nr:Uma2 family endonuclease [Saprospiraceae bacterium]